MEFNISIYRELRLVSDEGQFFCASSKAVEVESKTYTSSEESAGTDWSVEEEDTNALDAWRPPKFDVPQRLVHAFQELDVQPCRALIAVNRDIDRFLIHFDGKILYLFSGTQSIKETVENDKATVFHFQNDIRSIHSDGLQICALDATGQIYVMRLPEVPIVLHDSGKSTTDEPANIFNYISSSPAELVYVIDKADFPNLEDTGVFRKTPVRCSLLVDREANIPAPVVNDPETCETAAFGLILITVLYDKLAPLERLVRVVDLANKRRLCCSIVVPVIPMNSAHRFHITGFSSSDSPRSGFTMLSANLFTCLFGTGSEASVILLACPDGHVRFFNTKDWTITTMRELHQPVVAVKSGRIDRGDGMVHDNLLFLFGCDGKMEVLRDMVDIKNPAGKIHVETLLVQGPVRCLDASWDNIVHATEDDGFYWHKLCFKERKLALLTYFVPCNSIRSFILPEHSTDDSRLELIALTPCNQVALLEVRKLHKNSSLSNTQPFLEAIMDGLKRLDLATTLSVQTYNQQKEMDRCLSKLDSLSLLMSRLASQNLSAKLEVKLTEDELVIKIPLTPELCQLFVGQCVIFEVAVLDEWNPWTPIFRMFHQCFLVNATDGLTAKFRLESTLWFLLDEAAANIMVRASLSERFPAHFLCGNGYPMLRRRFLCGSFSLQDLLAERKTTALLKDWLSSLENTNLFKGFGQLESTETQAVAAHANFVLGQTTVTLLQKQFGGIDSDLMLQKLLWAPGICRKPGVIFPCVSARLVGERNGLVEVCVSHDSQIKAFQRKFVMLNQVKVLIGQACVNHARLKLNLPQLLEHCERLKSALSGIYPVVDGEEQNSYQLPLPETVTKLISELRLLLLTVPVL